MDSKQETEIIDNERLKWISFFHYVSGGFTITISLIFLMYVVFFGIIAFNPQIAHKSHAEDTRQVLVVMKIFIGIFGTLFLIGIVYGICEIISGTFIKKRKNRMFSIIVAIPRVLNIPYGTILSIFTLTMLGKPTVKEQYDEVKNSGKNIQETGA